jgi:hypothetical protein
LPEVSWAFRWSLPRCCSLATLAAEPRLESGVTFESLWRGREKGQEALKQPVKINDFQKVRPADVAKGGQSHSKIRGFQPEPLLASKRPQ